MEGIEQIPPTRLERPSVNNVLNEVVNNAAPAPPANDRAKQYSFFNTPSSFTPLSDQARVAHDTASQDRSNGPDHLFSKLQRPSPPNSSFLFKPLRKRRSTLSPDFLPPKTLESTLKNPIIMPKVSQNTIVARDEELDDDDEYFVAAAPSGEWRSPVVREAMGRQVNKERIFRSVVGNLVRLLVFHLVRAIVEYTHRMYQMNDAYTQVVQRHTAWANLVRNDQGWVATVLPYLWHVQYVFIVGLMVGVVRLAWPQDQCLDLPLTEKQRQLIGLRPLSREHDEADHDYAYTQKKRLFEARTNLSVDAPKYPQLSAGDYAAA